MNCLRVVALLFFVMSGTMRGVAQQAAAIDSIKMALDQAATTDEKAFWLDNLSRTLMNVNHKQAEEYGLKLITLAEESRDRKLMIYAYRSNAMRCSYFAGNRQNATQALDYYNKALDMARANRFDDEVGGIQLRMAGVYLSVPDKDKALSFATQGFTQVSGSKDDSLHAEGYMTYGSVYLARNEKIISLRNYLMALRIAEEMKIDKNNTKVKKSELMRRCYLHLSNFYKAIGDYDRAIDYYTMGMKKLEDSKQRNVPYQRVIDINEIGNLFAAKESYDIAINYFKRSLVMADSLKFSTLKVPGYISLLNQYLRMEQPMEALKYMQSKEGDDLKIFLNSFGLIGVSDQVYGVIYTETGQYDSARFYLDRATPYFENATNEINRLHFYGNVANLLKKTGNVPKAIEQYTKIKEMAEKVGSLESVKLAAKELDTLYSRTGNYQMASLYNSIYYRFKDSIETLNKEKEISQIEAADEQHRQERLVLEQQEAKRKKYNIQYLAITIGIAALFILMVMMGMFRVSATTIKLIGFFTFLMFFEFIFLIFKKNIAAITDGEPWKDLLFMIGLAAVLLPLHHWLEHRVIRYLTSHNRLTNSGKGLINRMFRRNKPTAT